MLRPRYHCLVLMILMGVASASSGDVPRFVNYQGVLTDAGGMPLQGPHTLAFRIYPDSTQGAVALWEEQHTSVEIEDGLFNVMLGGITDIPDTLFAAAERWLGIQVDTDSEMSPRFQIGSVPYALKSSLADSLPSLAAPGTINEPANPMDWTKLKNVPVDFSDGVDQVGTGGVGDGHSLDAADGDPTNVIYVNNEGNVGIGNVAPETKLDVTGTLQTTGLRLAAAPTESFVLTCDDTLGSASWQPSDTHGRILLSRWVTDWTADNSAALTSAIAAVQEADDDWSIVGARHSGGDVVILDVPDEEVLKLDSKVTVPGSRSVKFQADGPRGMRIEYTGIGDYAIYVDSGNRQVQFENIVFWKGGIEIDGGTKSLRFSDCHFDGIDDFAVRVLGPSVVDVAFRDCLFHDCAGGITVDFPACDFWVISNCNFWRNSDCDLVLGTTGVIAEQCDFELRDGGSLDKPYIHISGGGPFISNCRFGNENWAGYAPPASSIVIGPLSGGTSGTLSDIHIVDCKFIGNNVAPSSSSAQYAITFNKQPNYCRVSGNRFNAYYGDGTDNTPCCNSAYTDTNVRLNYWTDNISFAWGSIPPTDAEWGIVASHWQIH